MLTTASQIQRSSDRTPEQPHFFAMPVVRELPRPAPEPPSWSRCW